MTEKSGSGCGACETGTVDSREAVAERTGRYSQRVPVLQAPHPPIRLHVPVAVFQGKSGELLYKATYSETDPGGHLQQHQAPAATSLETITFPHLRVRLKLDSTSSSCSYYSPHIVIRGSSITLRVGC